MIKTVGIVSLSSGILGEPHIQFETETGIRRLEEYGLNIKFMPHALMGLDYVKAHPEAFDKIVWVLFDARTRAAYEKALKETLFQEEK